VELEHTIFDAVATVREAKAQLEHTNQALCVLSLDFQAAFDNISHQYRFQTLDRYGFSGSFRRRIRHKYENATSYFEPHSDKMQGCP
jgi:hypothetical protein